RALEELSKPETTRFKGLGEISPREMKHFMGADIRLEQVRMRAMGEVSKALGFYMGKNTPQRKSFIVDNLIAEVV
ncbi:MAG: type IIA DNA topoisomerase subunit B, partial [bacterium]|nr:type IIA DNA topoisomerase subunit B [bacterium]